MSGRLCYLGARIYDSTNCPACVLRILRLLVALSTDPKDGRRGCTGRSVGSGYSFTGWTDGTRIKTDVAHLLGILSTSLPISRTVSVMTATLNTAAASAGKASFTLAKHEQAPYGTLSQ